MTDDKATPAEITAATAAVEELVNRETRAWDTQDVDLLMTIFHPDMVWPWPKTEHDHDPLDWELTQGRYDAERWRAGWQALFDTHTLVHNVRTLRKIVVADQADGAFAVVDVDTLWRSAAGADFRWQGRACKVYTKVGQVWKMIAHYGLLVYPPEASSP